MKSIHMLHRIVARTKLRMARNTFDREILAIERMERENGVIIDQNRRLLETPMSLLNVNMKEVGKHLYIMYTLDELVKHRVNHREIELRKLP